MKKIILTLVSLLLLSSCANQASVLTKLNEEIEAIASSFFRLEASNHKKYYSYYIEPTMSIKESTASSSLIVSGGTQIVMNLNISAVITERYYDLNPKSIERRINQTNLISEIEGAYVDKFSQSWDYRLSVYQVNDFYIVYLRTPFVDLYANVFESDLVKVASQMMIISKSISIDEEKIVSNYSNRNEIDYIKEHLELFEIIVPENGRIEEILTGGKDPGIIEPTPTPEVESEGDSPEIDPNID